MIAPLVCIDVDVGELWIELGRLRVLYVPYGGEL